MRNLIAAALLIGIGAQAAQAQPVQDARSGHWYEMVEVPEGLTWLQALRAAQARSHQGMAGHLATLSTSTEQEFVAQAFRGFTRERWLGGYQIEGPSPGTGWRWITGEEWGATSWDPDEPNDLGGGEGALEMYGGGTGGKTPGWWNDDRPTSPAHGFIVEYEPLAEKTPPRVEVEGPAHGASLAALPSAVIAAADGESGVPLNGVRVVLFRFAHEGTAEGYWNGDGWTARRSHEAERPATPHGTRWAFQMPSPAQGFGPGRYALRAVALDRAGNRAESRSVQFDIQRAPQTPGATVVLPVEHPEQIQKAPSVEIAGAEVDAAGRSVFLHFSGTLDADRAALPKRYSVRMGGEEVPVEAASSLLGGVTLRLPEDALAQRAAAEAPVQVTWSGLRDAHGREVSGEVNAK